MRKSYLLALVALLSWPSQESRATDGVINSIGTAVAITGEVLTDGDTYLIYNTNAQNGGTSAYLHEDVSTHSLNITAGSSNPVVNDETYASYVFVFLKTGTSTGRFFNYKTGRYIPWMLSERVNTTTTAPFEAGVYTYPAEINGNSGFVKDHSRSSLWYPYRKDYSDETTYLSSINGVFPSNYFSFVPVTMSVEPTLYSVIYQEKDASGNSLGQETLRQPAGTCFDIPWVAGYKCSSMKVGTTVVNAQTVVSGDATVEVTYDAIAISNIGEAIGEVSQLTDGNHYIIQSNDKGWWLNEDGDCNSLGGSAPVANAAGQAQYVYTYIATASGKGYLRNYCSGKYLPVLTDKRVNESSILKSQPDGVKGKYIFSVEDVTNKLWSICDDNNRFLIATATEMREDYASGNNFKIYPVTVGTKATYAVTYVMTDEKGNSLGTKTVVACDGEAYHAPAQAGYKCMKMTVGGAEVNEGNVTTSAATVNATYRKPMINTMGTPITSTDGLTDGGTYLLRSVASKWYLSEDASAKEAGSTGSVKPNDTSMGDRVYIYHRTEEGKGTLSNYCTGNYVPLLEKDITATTSRYEKDVFTFSNGGAASSTWTITGTNGLYCSGMYSDLTGISNTNYGYANFEIIPVTVKFPSSYVMACSPVDEAGASLGADISITMPEGGGEVYAPALTYHRPVSFTMNGATYAGDHMTVVAPTADVSGVKVTYGEEYPFRTTTITNKDFDTNTLWYGLKMNDHYYCIKDLTYGTVLRSDYASNPPSNDNTYLYCFTGNMTDNFQIFNKAMGAEKPLQIRQSIYNFEGVVFSTIDNDFTKDSHWKLINNSGADNMTLSTDNSYYIDGRSDGLIIHTADGLPTYRTMIFTPLQMDVKVGSALMATLYSDQELTIPTGVKAYVATSVNNETKKVQMTEITGTVPANTGVLITATAADTYTFLVSSTGATYTGTNLFHGSAFEVKNITANDYYVLANGENGVGFYKLNDTSLGACRAYLLASDLAGISSSKGYIPDFGGTTDIKSVPKEGKGIQDVFYDLTGRKVSNPSKGIYIKNGIKIYINK